MYQIIILMKWNNKSIFLTKNIKLILFKDANQMKIKMVLIKNYTQFTKKLNKWNQISKQL